MPWETKVEEELVLGKLTLQLQKLTPLWFIGHHSLFGGYCLVCVSQPLCGTWMTREGTGLRV